ncbi:26S proteasome non-ATPase regulatory subunit 4-like protein [Diplonema papillatum]|nr:26S proteasome non-ATPase regulatory subunit 4-like protein [Diplonema papillatum]
MTLEATHICIDNSESMRNGDFAPNRLQAVTNACHLLCGAKTQRNPENEVGFLTMADDRVRIEETLTSDLGRLLASLTNVRPGGG